MPPSPPPVVSSASGPAPFLVWLASAGSSGASTAVEPDLVAFLDRRFRGFAAAVVSLSSAADTVAAAASLALLATKRHELLPHRRPPLPCGRPRNADEEEEEEDAQWVAAMAAIQRTATEASRERECTILGCPAAPALIYRAVGAKARKKKNLREREPPTTISLRGEGKALAWQLRRLAARVVAATAARPPPPTRQRRRTEPAGVLVLTNDWTKARTNFWRELKGGQEWRAGRSRGRLCASRWDDVASLASPVVDVEARGAVTFLNHVTENRRNVVPVPKHPQG
ncbi:hypothetical protein U9M48_025733 [Paspalum notatum var. saurae]|uniref:Uncharacterized protein n=1 Tax=Paspalum notatum var. saurae TaxID=547442 RepID=A0AAQ3WY87_PASNO